MSKLNLCWVKLMLGWVVTPVIAIIHGRAEQSCLTRSGFTVGKLPYHHILLYNRAILFYTWTQSRKTVPDLMRSVQPRQLIIFSYGKGDEGLEVGKGGGRVGQKWTVWLRMCLVVPMIHINTLSVVVGGWLGGWEEKWTLRFNSAQLSWSLGFAEFGNKTLFDSHF